MEYLEEVLGIRVRYENSGFQHLPDCMRGRYQIQKVFLDGIAVFFLYPENELEQVGTLQRYISRIQQKERIPVVLVLESLTYRQREYLLKAHIPFIVEWKQMYLPFLAVHMRERCDAERSGMAAITPSAQVLLLYYIYHGTGELVLSEVKDRLKLTAMSIIRAARQLEALELVRTRKDGVKRVLFSGYTPQEMFEKGKAYLDSPVKRAVFVPKEELGDRLLKSGDTALAEYSAIDVPMVCCYAADSIAKYQKKATRILIDAGSQCRLEMWRYDPNILAETDCVDRLSLALALKDDRDEQIKKSVEDMLEQLWEEISGT